MEEYLLNTDKALDAGPSDTGIVSCAWADQARLDNTSSIGQLNIEGIMKSNKRKLMKIWLHWERVQRRPQGPGMRFK